MFPLFLLSLEFSRCHRHTESRTDVCTRRNPRGGSLPELRRRRGRPLHRSALPRLPPSPDRARLTPRAWKGAARRLLTVGTEGPSSDDADEPAPVPAGLSFRAAATLPERSGPAGPRGRRYSVVCSGSGSWGGKWHSRICPHRCRTTKPVVSACARISFLSASTDGWVPGAEERSRLSLRHGT